jgi:hypothetical protein
MVDNRRMRKVYPSDINREQFEQIRSLLESASKKTRPRTVDLYEVWSCPGFADSVALGFQAISVVAVDCSVARVGEHRSHSKQAGVRSEDFV